MNADDPKFKKLKTVWELVQAEAAKERLDLPPPPGLPAKWERLRPPA